MLDKRCLALLNVINCQCENSGYKVFSVEELVLLMPQRFGIDGAGIVECIANLVDHEYVSVKYQDDSEICVCPLTKGRLIFENKIDEELEKTRAQTRYFAYSFLGAFFGGALILFIAVIIAVWGGV